MLSDLVHPTRAAVSVSTSDIDIPHTLEWQMNKSKWSFAVLRNCPLGCKSTLAHQRTSFQVHPVQEPTTR